MTNELITKPLERMASQVFYYGFTQNTAHKGAARLWDGIDGWVATQPPDSKRIRLQHASYLGNDERMSLLIERSLKRHSYTPPTLGDVNDVQLAAVIMYLIVSQPRLLSSIPDNLEINPDTGYITRKTVVHTRVA